MSLPSVDAIIADLEFLDDWEERYGYIIDLGRELPPMDDALKTSESMVKGCQSDVWLVPREENGRLWFQVDSDALIVRGLLALVLAAYQGQTAEAIRAFDTEAYFQRLDLERHLSPMRGNGLRAIVGRVREIAEQSS